MTKKLNIYDVLRNIDSGNMNYYDELSDAEKKQFSPFMTYRWLIGTKDKEAIKRIDAEINGEVEFLFKYPKLLYKMLASTSDGKQKRYKYIFKKKKQTISSTSLEIIMDYYDCDIHHAKDYLRLLTLDDIKDMAIELGEQDEIIKKIK